LRKRKVYIQSIFDGFSGPEVLAAKLSKESGKNVASIITG